jgi:hypothetical protein
MGQRRVLPLLTRMNHDDKLTINLQENRDRKKVVILTSSKALPLVDN